MSILVALIVGAATLGIAVGAGATSATVLAQAKTAPAPPPDDSTILGVRGVVAAVDKERQTILIKGRRRSLLLNVRDPRQFEVITVGMPVVAKFYQSIVLDLKRFGEFNPSTPLLQSQPGTVALKPGDPPASTLGRQVTVAGPILFINPQTQTITIKGPEGYPELPLMRDINLLAKLKVGDVVQVTYTQRLAISLEKPTDLPPAEKKQPAGKTN